MKGTIKFKNPEGMINVGDEMGGVYPGKTDAQIPLNWKIGDVVDFNFGPKESTGEILNRGELIPWIAVNHEGERILDANP
jgi:hypothetical protein